MTSQPSSTVIVSPIGTVNHDEELALSDTDLANVKFKLSPSEAMQYLQSASTSVSQLFKYDSVDSLPEKSSLASPPNVEKIKVEKSDGYNYVRVVSEHSPASTSSESAGVVRSGMQSGINGCAQRHPGREQMFRGKRGPDEAARAAMEAMTEGGGEDDSVEEAEMKFAGIKKLRVEPPGMVGVGGSVSSNMRNHTHSHIATRGSVTTPPLTPISPVHPNTMYSHSRPSSRLNSPEPSAGMGGVAPSGPVPPVPPLNNNRSTYASPYVTPHGTPGHTPYQSPLPSPLHTPTLQHQPHTFPSVPQTSPSSSHFSSPGPAVAGSNHMRSAMDGGHERGFNVATSPPSALSSLSLPGFSTARGGVIQLHQQHSAPG